jgi:hypothetical protein
VGKGYQPPIQTPGTSDLMADMRAVEQAERIDILEAELREAVVERDLFKGYAIALKEKIDGLMLQYPIEWKRTSLTPMGPPVSAPFDDILRLKELARKYGRKMGGS